jgi:hypothetical protein
VILVARRFVPGLIRFGEAFSRVTRAPRCELERPAGFLRRSAE